jgi:hypothetical protein
MLTTDADRIKTGNDFGDQELASSKLERHLLHYFARVEVVGKNYRIVPVLLCPLLLKALQTVMKGRLSAGVHRDNKFVFGVNNKVMFKRNCPYKVKKSEFTVRVMCNSLVDPFWRKFPLVHMQAKVSL